MLSSHSISCEHSRTTRLRNIRRGCPLLSQSAWIHLNQFQQLAQHGLSVEGLDVVCLGEGLSVVGFNDVGMSVAGFIVVGRNAEEDMGVVFDRCCSLNFPLPSVCK
jgi:hypothetical protein